MANPHPEPHPENLRPFKKGDASAKGTQRKGARASNAKQAQAKSMRELALYYGQLPVKKGSVKLPKTASKEDAQKANPTMDALVIAAMYNKAAKGDVRAAEFLTKLKGEMTEDVTVHIDTMSEMPTEDPLKLYESTGAEE